MTLKVGFPHGWADLIPSLQHTAYADKILKNQFEPLVFKGKDGKTHPLSAKSWVISKDMRIFTFTIDTEKKFSNGTPLSARHFKEAWEHSLTLPPKSSNNSLLDTLYNIEGFEESKESGHISGIEALSDETLRISFKNSFRMGLAQLCRGSLSAFVIDKERYLGTGPYVIEEIDSENLLLTQNPYYLEPLSFKEVSITAIRPYEAIRALSEGQIDMYHFAALVDTSACSLKNIECLSEFANNHIVMNLNNMEGRFFSNRNHRKALQYLFFQGFTSESIPQRDRLKIKIDSQIFLPIQSGRLDKEEVDKMIEEGEKYVDELIKATQKEPIYIALSETFMWYKSYLEERGLKFSEESNRIHKGELLRMNSKTHEPDIMLWYKSVSSGDPDGIYHMMSVNGPISSPMSLNKEISDLLEEGRSIIELDKLDPHYKKINEIFLRESPFIHVGFLKNLVMIRNDRVKSMHQYFSQEDGRLIDYDPVR